MNMKLITRLLPVLLFICIHPHSSAAQSTQPAAGEIRRGMSMSDAPDARYAKWFDKLARQVEPELQGNPERLGLYLKFFEHEIIREPRLFAFEVSAVKVEGTTRIVGMMEYPEQVATLQRLLSTLNLGSIEYAIEVAPTDQTEGLRFAIAKQDAFLFASPEKMSEKVNQAMHGEPLWIIGAAEGERRYLAHSADGYVGWIDTSVVQPVDSTRMTATLNKSPARDAALIERVIDDAMSRMGKPYVWAGRSDDGVDCSGLVQRAFAAAGVMLPRDAEQQAICGKLVAMRHHREALRRGDVLFFLGRRGFVAHTGIYLGEGRFIESADGGVRISEFNSDNTRNRREDSFCFAKRMLD